MIRRHIPRPRGRLDGYTLAAFGVAIVGSAVCAVAFFMTRHPLWITAAALAPAMSGVFIALGGRSDRTDGDDCATRDARAHGRALARRIAPDGALSPMSGKTSET